MHMGRAAFRGGVRHEIFMPNSSRPHEQTGTPADVTEGRAPTCAGRRREYEVHSALSCSMFVLDEEVAVLDRLLGAEISALFDH